MAIRLALLLTVAALCSAQSDEIAEVWGDVLDNLYSLGKEDIWAAAASNGITEECLEDLDYIMHNKAAAGIRLSLLDASPKIPVGVLKGSFVHIGHYDECVDIEDTLLGRFHGQHCMVDVNISVPALKVNLPLFYGVCTPSTCTPEDVKIITEFLVHNATKDGLPAKVKLDPENCRTSGIESPPAGVWVVVAVIICFVLVGVASTAFDVYERFWKNNSKPHQLLSAFSYYTNGKYLLQTTNDPSMMTALFGIRTITMGWVVLGHAYLNTVYSSVVNLVDIPKLNADDFHVIIFNSFVSVDTFFLLSGMLACFVFFRNIFKNKTFDAPMGYLHRFFRLTPPLAAIVLFESTLFNYLGNGPMWHRIHNQASLNCQDYWWSTLLFVQNYVNPLKLCLTQSWYLSADMQMYWISPFILYPMYLFPVIAVPFLIFLVLGISFMDFAIVYVYELPPNFVLQPSDNRMIMDYYPFHTRMAPWLVGVALGYLIGGIRAKKIKVNLTPFWTTVGWILSTVLMTASMQGMAYFNQNMKTYTPLEAAFFLAFHRVGWAIGLAWIIFACATGIGGFVDKILSFPLFQPLAKLSFCSYLIHISVQRFRIGYLKTNMNLADVDVVWLFIGDFCLSNIISIPLFLLFEQPFMHIDRYFFSNLKIFEYPRRRRPIDKDLTKVKPEDLPKAVATEEENKIKDDQVELQVNNGTDDVPRKSQEGPTVRRRSKSTEDVKVDVEASSKM